MPLVRIFCLWYNIREEAETRQKKKAIRLFADERACFFDLKEKRERGKRSFSRVSASD